jgi:hypothetical protein
MNMPEVFRIGRVRRARHGAARTRDVVRSEPQRWDGCVYPDAAMNRPIGALADRTWLGACGFRRW